MLLVYFLFHILGMIFYLCVLLLVFAIVVCFLLKVPFIVIRSISDFVFENENFQTHNDNVESSTTNSALVFLSLIGMKQNLN